jgi:hypothetical protein
METLLEESLTLSKIGTMIVGRDLDHDALVKKYQEAIHFIEMTEALTYDEATAKRIHSFLTQQGIWTK